MSLTPTCHCMQGRKGPPGPPGQKGDRGLQGEHGTNVCAPFSAVLYSVMHFSDTVLHHRAQMGLQAKWD